MLSIEIVPFQGTYRPSRKPMWVAASAPKNCSPNVSFSPPIEADETVVVPVEGSTEKSHPSPVLVPDWSVTLLFWKTPGPPPPEAVTYCTLAEKVLALTFAGLPAHSGTRMKTNAALFSGLLLASNDMDSRPCETVRLPMVTAPSLPWISQFWVPDWKSQVYLDGQSHLALSPVPAQDSPPLQLVPQQSSPKLPQWEQVLLLVHARVLALHCMVPSQHGFPSVPHAPHVLLAALHARLAPHLEPLAQQGWPLPPQVQVLLLQANPELHDVPPQQG